MGAGSNRVLLVEDETGIRDFVREALEAEGIELEWAANGRVGLEAALRGGHDLIVLDIMLPEANGLEVLRDLRKGDIGTPVILLTARSELPVKILGFELGATDYLTKPFAIEELLARVRVQLRTSVDGGEGTIRAGDLELDVATREARVGDTRVRLSDREFGTLRCLAENAGSVISREQLLEEVWGMDFHPGTNVVDVCVRRLRKKLGPDAHIETIRNGGYSLML